MDIVISNTAATARFDRSTGFLISVALGGPNSAVLDPCRPFDLIVDGRLQMDTDDIGPDAVEIASDQHCVQLIYELDGLRITHVAGLDPQLPILRQSLRVVSTDSQPRRLTAVHWKVCGFVVGEAAECRLQAPGQVLVPDLAYEDAALITLDRTADQPHPTYPQGWLESCPDQSQGLIVVENSTTGCAVGVWQYSESAPVFPTINGDSRLVTIEHRHQIGAWLVDGAPAVLSDGHTVAWSGIGMGGIINEYRRSVPAFNTAAPGGCATLNAMAAELADGVSKRGSPVVNAPRRHGSNVTFAAAVADMRIIQVIPNKSANFGPSVDRTSIVDLTRELDTVKALGFNTVYLLPVWACQEANVYAIAEHYAIDDGVGTIGELREYVASAHRLGLKVMFDFIPQGTGDSSRLVAENPDWLVRDHLGRPFGSHGWGPKPGESPNGHTYSLDWGNAECRRFLVDWALWNVRTFDIDGFRTDALLWKEPNFAPHGTRPAWETSFGGVRLADELRAATRRVKKDFFLLGEVWGPIFARNHDATYQNGWLLGKINAGWLVDEPYFTARQWMRWLEMNQAIRPDRYPHANFTLNHDSVELLALLSNPIASAVSFMHVFTPGIPLVFRSELEGREAFFREALHQRSQLCSASGRVGLAITTNEHLFTTCWMQAGSPPVVAVANVSVQAVTDTLNVDAASVGIRMASPGATASITKQGPTVVLPAGGYILFELAT